MDSKFRVGLIVAGAHLVCDVAALRLACDGGCQVEPQPCDSFDESGGCGSFDERDLFEYGHYGSPGRGFGEQTCQGVYPPLPPSTSLPISTVSGGCDDRDRHQLQRPVSDGPEHYYIEGEYPDVTTEHDGETELPTELHLTPSVMSPPAHGEEHDHVLECQFELEQDTSSRKQSGGAQFVVQSDARGDVIGMMDEGQFAEMMEEAPVVRGSGSRSQSQRDESDDERKSSGGNHHDQASVRDEVSSETKGTPRRSRATTLDHVLGHKRLPGDDDTTTTTTQAPRGVTASYIVFNCNGQEEHVCPIRSSGTVSADFIREQYQIVWSRMVASHRHPNGCRVLIGEDAWCVDQRAGAKRGRSTTMPDATEVARSHAIPIQNGWGFGRGSHSRTPSAAESSSYRVTVGSWKMQSSLEECAKRSGRDLMEEIAVRRQAEIDSAPHQLSPRHDQISPSQAHIRQLKKILNNFNI